MEDIGIKEGDARKIAIQANGSYSNALNILNKDSGDEIFEGLFIKWVRSAFRAKGNKASILDLIAWSEEVASLGREAQKSFLLYCLDFFRQAFLYNYKATDLVYMEIKDPGFKMEKFAAFIDGFNIKGITEELETAIYHIERNGNARLILTDLSIKLTRLLHKKAA